MHLDLGALKDIAEVSANGKELGILWKAPYDVDVTGFNSYKADSPLLPAGLLGPVSVLELEFPK